MMDKCSMHACEMDSSDDTRTLWTVDPDNTSERPVCWYHSKIDRMMRSEFVPIVILGIPWVVTVFLAPKLGMIASIGLFISSFILTMIGLFVSIMSLEFAIRYLKSDIQPIATRHRTKEENGRMTNQSCSKCGNNKSQGVWRECSHKLELFGSPIRTYSEVTNVYCEECYDEEFTEDGHVSTDIDRKYELQNC